MLALDVVRSAETTEMQLKELDSDSSLKSPNEGKRPPIKIFNCTKSGTRHGARECPANGKTCHNCQRKHHFESMCRSRKKIRGLEQQQQEYDSDLTLFVGAVTSEI